MQVPKQAQCATEAETMINWFKSARLGARRSGGYAALMALLLACCVPSSAWADDVSILGAKFRGGAQERWNVSVTLRHADTGWEHYADAWRVISKDGAVFGTRTLLHPHETEQPFTRSLSGVDIPKAVTGGFYRSALQSPWLGESTLAGGCRDRA